MNQALDPRRYAFREDLAASYMKGKVNARRFTDGKYFRVVDPAASILSSPKQDTYLATEALYGEHITVFERHRGWAWGQLARDGYVGYLHDTAIVPATRPSTHRVAAPLTYLFPGPDIKLTPLHLLSMEAEVSIMAIEGKFAVTADGAYLIERHLAKLERYASDFVTVALKFLNVPYRWGGKQSLGLDCSGLVQLSLHRAGISCPRDSDMQQADLGEFLDDPHNLDQLRRGDLVFWQGHVGIMVDDNRLIHANGYHMATAIEPVRDAVARIAEEHGPVTSLKRLPAPA